MRERLRVLAVNHNRILREGIAVLLEMDRDFELVDTVATSDAVVKVFSATRPDVTLVDLDLPADGGFDAISRIREMDPTAWIIGLTLDERDDRCLRAVMAGVTTLLTKDQVGAFLNPVIRAGRPPKYF